ncbi:MAG: 2-dehydropantoate 2-reductase [Verrucomicrobiales bacterium]|nr:2-dehydropantoate 2-reductase [Verrucomicrobiales bacterium]
MKIAILGAGSMGSTLGSVLAKAGNDVTLIDVWKDAIVAINRDGLKVQNKTGDISVHKVRAVTSPAELAGPADLLLVFVKCYHTAEAVKSALPLLGPNSTVLSLQNGWGNGPRIAEIVGQERVVLGVCYHSATVLGPGHVLHAGQGKTFIGEMDGAVSPRVLAIAEAFSKAGLEIEASAQVLKEIWSKLALNVATLPTQSTIKLTAEELPNTPDMQNLMRALLLEVVAVAQVQGIALDFTERWSAITGLLRRLAPNTKGSMLQDVENHRRTEIDVMCGAIIEAGQRLGIATPYNHAMLWLVKALEANYPKP